MRIFREVTFEIEHTKILDNVNLDIDSGINILQGKNGVGKSTLLKIILGMIPLAIFLLSPPNAFLSGICIPMGIIGMLSPMPDYMDVHIICKQVPKGAFVHTQNDGFYWYK